jgi:hypothetical protein
LPFHRKYEGRRWCYVATSESKTSSCSDLKNSVRYPGLKWSYKACTYPVKEACYNAYRMQEVRASTHCALFGRSLEFSCVRVLLVVYYSRINFFFLVLLKLYNLHKT